MASAYSLFIVGTTSLVGVIPKYKQRLVSIRTGLTFGMPAILTSFITRRWIVPAIPDMVAMIGNFTITKRLLILGIFAIVMIVTSFSMIRPRIRIHASDQPVRVMLTLLEGLLIGLLTGLVGASGGFLLTPALVLLTGLPMKTAAGTSLFIIAVNSLIAFAGDSMIGSMDWNLLLIITSIAITGVLIGNAISRHLSNAALRKGFGWFTLAMGIVILVWETARQ